MSDEGQAVSAVTFDFWNTLCCEPPGGYLRGRRLEAMSQVLVDAGVGSAGVVLPVLTRGYDAAWASWHDGWQANRQFTGADGAHTICDVLERTFADSPAVAGLRSQLCEAFARQSEGAELNLVDGVADTLAGLSTAGRTPGDHLRRRLHRVADPARAPGAPRDPEVLRPLVVLRRGRRLQAPPGDFSARPDRAGRAGPGAVRPRGRPPAHGRGRGPGRRHACRSDHDRLQRH